MKMIDVIYDMDTGDPDDSIALLILLSNKNVNLRGITLYPGSKDQIGFIKYLLSKLGRDEIPVGGYDLKSEKYHVSQGIINMYGEFKPMTSDREGYKIFTEFYKNYPNGISINTAPLGNLYTFLETKPNVEISKVFVQSGFAGVNCIPPENQLDRFKGLKEFPTYNFNGFRRGAWAFLSSNIIEKKYLISKDITHGVFYESQLHEKVKDHCSTKPEFELIWLAMDYYLRKRPKGKKLHDPIAVCAAINPEIVKFMEVECYKKKGAWGSYPKQGTNIFITVEIDYDLFLKTFLDEK